MLRIGSRRWVRSKVLAAAGTAAILLGAGGTALAVTAGGAPVSHGQVKGCYASTTGALRVLTARAPRCGRGEKAISWPQTANVINGYASTFKFKFGKNLTTKLTPIAVLKLAPGSYIVSLTANLLDIGPSTYDWAQCEILDGKTVIGVPLTTVPYDSSFGEGFGNLAATAYSPHGGLITMKCSDELAQSIVYDWELTATQVSHLTLGPNTVGAAPRGSSVKLPSAG
jgi:hypothetical protein